MIRNTIGKWNITSRKKSHYIFDRMTRESAVFPFVVQRKNIRKKIQKIKNRMNSIREREAVAPAEVYQNVFHSAYTYVVCLSELNPIWPLLLWNLMDLLRLQKCDMYASRILSGRFWKIQILRETVNFSLLVCSDISVALRYGYIVKMHRKWYVSFTVSNRTWSITQIENCNVGMKYFT